MDILRQDLRFALRMLWKTPGFTAVAVITLALGIGANTAVFSLINAALLHPIAGVGEPGRLIMIGRTTTTGRYATSSDFDTLSYRNFLDLQAQAKTLDGVGAYTSTMASLLARGEPSMVSAAIVTGNYFDVLRVVPARGRLMHSGDDDPKASLVAVLSYALWQRLGGRDDVIGSVITVGGRPVTVVGVAARAFRGVDPTDIIDIWVPLPMQPVLMMGNFNYLESPQARELDWLQAFGRLKAGVSFEAASAEIHLISGRLAAAYPKENATQGLTAIPGLGLDPGDREQIKRLTVILFGAVGLVLLLACTNVANLMLARAASRQRDVAVRVALGASRGRIMRQFFTESIVLAVIAGAVGLMLSVWMSEGLQRLSPGSSVPLPADITLDRGVLIFTVVIALLTGVLFGLAPALRSFVRDLVPVLKEATRGSASRGKLGPALIVAEVSLSLVLLAAAGLLMNTLVRLQRVDPGFRTRDLVMANVFPALQGYDEDRSRQLYEEIQRRLEAVPGVQSVTISRVRPMSPGGWSSSYEVQDLPKDHRSAQFNTVATNYFDVMGIDIVKGRRFSPTDRVGSPLVAVINQTMARTLWPNQSAVGKHIKVGNDQHWREVIGVARDVKRRTLTEEPSPYLYLSMSQPMPFWRTSSTILIQTQLPPESVVTPARNVVRSLDSRIPLYGIRTLSQQFAYSYWQQRIAGWLIGAFATLALLLAAVGVYGVISYEVTARTREVGIRMALGARQHEVLGLVLRRGAILAACGIGLGAVAGLLLTRALKALLFGISSYDPATFALTALLLATVALAASFVPARRAARVDPMVALRYE